MEHRRHGHGGVPSRRLGLRDGIDARSTSSPRSRLAGADRSAEPTPHIRCRRCRSSISLGGHSTSRRNPSNLCQRSGLALVAYSPPGPRLSDWDRHPVSDAIGEPETPAAAPCPGVCPWLPPSRLPRPSPHRPPGLIRDRARVRQPSAVEITTATSAFRIPLISLPVIRS